MTRKELEALGLEKEAIDKIIAINGNDIENAKSKATGDYATLETSKKELETKVNLLEQEKLELTKLSGDADAYKKKIEDYEKLEAERLLNATKEAEEKEILTKISESVKDKEFINEFTKSAIIGEVKTKSIDKAYFGKSISEILEEVTKDKDVYKNPQGGVIIPPTGKFKDTDKFTKEQIDKMSSKEINENWAIIQKSLG